VEGGRARFRAIFRADLPSCAVQPRNDTIVGAHFGRAGQGPKMDPRRVARLVEQTVVGEGEQGWVSKGSKVKPLTLTAHPARARRRVRATRTFISPEAASAPDLLVSPGPGAYRITGDVSINPVVRSLLGAF
jgi:hypothetical protein